MLRKQVEIGLNKGEARNALSRTVDVHRNGEVRDLRPTTQANRASGLNLVEATFADLITFAETYVFASLTYGQG